MKRITLLLCLLFLGTSCEIQYDGETRLVVSGILIDQDDRPISNKEIEIDILDGPGLLGPTSDLISFVKSNQEGKFTLVFSAPQLENRISISINDSFNSSNGYQAVNIISNEKNFENYKLDLKNIKLYKLESITNLRLILNPISSNKQIKDVSIDGKQPNSFIDLVVDPTTNSNVIPPINTSYNVIKNQIVTLKYTVIDYSNNGAATVQSIAIPIANEAVTYTITY